MSSDYRLTIDEFEAGDVDAERFDHEAHVYIAWRYLQDCDLLEAIGRYRAALRRLTRKLGVPEKYHETMTWFYMITIAERTGGDAGSDWEEFRTANPELFDRSVPLVRHHYSESRLMSDRARQVYLLPDLAG